MADSRNLAGLAGPAMIALGVTEALNMDMYDAQIAPLVYLNGLILFVAGLALVRAHNRWVRSWPLLITLLGWTLLFVGLYRMIAPDAPQASATPATYAVLTVMTLIGAVLTYKAYGPRRAPPDDRP